MVLFKMNLLLIYLVNDMNAKKAKRIRRDAKRIGFNLETFSGKRIYQEAKKRYKALSVTDRKNI